MKVLELDGPWYHCNHCGNWFNHGAPEEEVVADGDYSLEDGEPINIVPTRIAYKCHDGNPEGANPCRFSSDDEEDGNVIYAKSLWECGNCENKYTNVGDGIACCQ